MLQYTPNPYKDKALFLDNQIFILEDEVCLSKIKSTPSVPEDSVSYQSINTTFSDDITSSSL
jgi:hypothetical protein